MGQFPFPDNDDRAADWDDPDPVECCRHEIPVAETCDACNEAAEQRFAERYHGSDQAVTIQERYQQAAEQKRRAG